MKTKTRKTVRLFYQICNLSDDCVGFYLLLQRFHERKLFKFKIYEREKDIENFLCGVCVCQAGILNVFNGFRMYLKDPETALGFTQFSYSAFTWLVSIAT